MFAGLGAPLDLSTFDGEPDIYDGDNDSSDSHADHCYEAGVEFLQLEHVRRNTGGRAQVEEHNDSGNDATGVKHAVQSKDSEHVDTGLLAIDIRDGSPLGPGLLAALCVDATQ